MSSSAQGGSGGGEEKGKGQSFNKFMRRASKVLRRGSSSKVSSSSNVSNVPTEPTAPVPAVVSSPKPTPIEAAAPPAPLQAASPPVAPPQAASPQAASPQAASPPAGPLAAFAVVPEESPVAAAAAEAPLPTVQEALQQAIKDTKPIIKIIGNHRLATTAAVSSALMEEKARSLFAKYGLKLEPADWTPPFRADAQRVEKKIRLRVHRECHRCQVTFGSERICKNCKHTRCKKCPRYPSKKSKLPEDKEKDKLPAGPIVLTIPSRATGKELVRSNPVQRVRRTCHKCETLFDGRSTQCQNCNHMRCPRCPRDPPKLDKYPDGYPGDTEETFPLARRELHPIRVHVRWTCHECSVLFKDTERKCRNCSHERCAECSREPPEEEEQLDPDAIASVERKLKELAVTPQASASAA